MPLHQLAIAPVDVSGALLGLVLNAPAPRPLATHRLAHTDGSALQLGVLGASHVVTVEGRFCEEVSCVARSRGGDLPESTHAPATTSNPIPRRTTRRRFGDSRATCVNAARGQPGGWAVCFPVMTPR
ncbi:hypothetical protein AL79_02499 [Mycobacterium tuberculosis TKK_03_0156]|nr:hypothetical protein AL79_02499 [Mycobacterium tuberculosis TKK_03_0156]